MVGSLGGAGQNFLVVSRVILPGYELVISSGILPDEEVLVFGKSCAPSFRFRSFILEFTLSISSVVASGVVGR